MDDEKCHADNKEEITYGTKMWTDTEIKSSILFEVPKEKLRDENNSAANAISLPSEPTINKNEASRNAVDMSSNETTDINSPNVKLSIKTRTVNDSKKKVLFQGVPMCKPVKTHDLGFRRPPRLADQKKKKIDHTLNHACFIHATDTLEEDMHLMNETYSLPEVMNSP